MNFMQDFGTIKILKIHIFSMKKSYYFDNSQT